jgi:hypothetical protein
LMRATIHPCEETKDTETLQSHIHVASVNKVGTTDSSTNMNTQS